jgi:transcriptional regulator with XRE-family HTH domain
MAIEYLADPLSDFTQEEVAQKVGVSRRTISRWLKNPEFIEALQHEVTRRKYQVRPAAWRALVKKVVAGDVAALKLFFTMIHEYIPTEARASLNLNKLLYEPVDPKTAIEAEIAKKTGPELLEDMVELMLSTGVDEQRFHEVAEKIRNKEAEGEDDEDEFSKT